jgi:hypothetical protein
MQDLRGTSNQFIFIDWVGSYEKFKDQKSMAELVVVLLYFTEYHAEYLFIVFGEQVTNHKLKSERGIKFYQ